MKAFSALFSGFSRRDNRAPLRSVAPELMRRKHRRAGDVVRRARSARRYFAIRKPCGRHARRYNDLSPLAFSLS